MFYNDDNNEIFSRFTMMLSEKQIKNLFSARIIVFGVGGVGVGSVGCPAPHPTNKTAQTIKVNKPHKKDFNLFIHQCYRRKHKLSTSFSIKKHGCDTVLFDIVCCN